MFVKMIEYNLNKMAEQDHSHEKKEINLVDMGIS